MHEGPQKLTTTGRPRSDVRSNGWPSSVVPTIGGATSPTAAWPSDELPLTNHHTPAGGAAAVGKATRVRRRGGKDPRVRGHWAGAGPRLGGGAGGREGD